jgi:predicted Zn finger-like uncharacterized protein
LGFLDMSAEIGDLGKGFARASDSLHMILTCPECATGYFVEDGQIRPGGRTVKCAACGARWTAQPASAPLDLSANTTESADVKALPLDAADAETLTGEDLPRVFRGRAEEERRMRKAAVTGIAWGGVLVALLLLIGLGVIFRDGVVAVWPQTASLYAAVGLPVNPTGLVIEQVRAEPSLDQGHATLAVSGLIRNVTDHPVTAPPLRISLVNAQGKRVAGQIANLDNARLPPGETRRFATAIFDPPYSAANLQVDFVLGARPPATVSPVRTVAAPPATTTPAFTLRGLPAPSNAAAPPANTAVTITTSPATAPQSAPPPPAANTATSAK